MSQKPKTLWAFWANTYGARFTDPVKVTLNKNNGFYWEKGQNYPIAKCGLSDEIDERGHFSFASTDKKEVQTFIKGYNACRDTFQSLFQ